MKKINSLIATLLFSVAIAQIPTLEVDNQKKHPVILQDAKIDTKILGNLATTTATYTFYNPSNRILEGKLTFPLPEGVSVSGYALDINGKLRNAVPVPKERAKEVFESIERRNVDPGIIEKVEGNNFRTRIYPIPQKGSRTIQITYHQELKNVASDYQYFLSFANATTIPKFNLKVWISETATVPKILENPDGSFAFQKQGNQWIAEIAKSDFTPNESLKVTIPKNQNLSNVVLQKASGDKFYFAANVGLNFPVKEKPKSQKIAIIWDNSFSGSKRNRDKELDFLNAYFADNKNVSVSFSLLNNIFEKAEEFNISQGNWSELKARILNLKYDGGTDFGALKEINGIEEYLLFSDGISNFGDLTMKFKKPLNSIVSTPTSDFNLLKLLANQSGGNFINLNELDTQSALKTYKKLPVRFLGFKENPNMQELFPNISSVISEPVNIFGITSGNAGKLTAVFSVGNEKFETPVDFSKAQQLENWQVAQFWAQKKINELELNSTQNRQEIKNISEQFGVVSKNTSLIVLDDINDYVRYKITPPQELLADYQKIVSQNKGRVLEQRKNLLSKAFDKTRELKTWWNTEFKPVEKKEYPRVINQSTRDTTSVARGLDEVVLLGYTPNANRAVEMEASSSDAMVDIIAEKPKGKITLVDVESTEEYMKDFQNLQSAEVIYQKYLENRSKHEKQVSYYFDISKLLFKKGDKALSLKVLSTLAELDLENEELYKTIYYLLKQRGHYDKELWITQKILEWRPFDAQSHRDYALALVDNKKTQEALNIYKSLLYQEFTDEISMRDNGIEEILIMEINNILKQNKNVDGSKIDDRLKADLPVDIRVVINWNKDNTDIDLWVTDPKGEDCSYQHKSTAIGGRISNDFTQGFGPEQFLLKKAVKGKYKIKTNFFGERQNILSGPTTVMAEVYLYYSDGRQERKIAVFQSQKENKKENDSKILIGEFEF
ncbi:MULTISPECIES: VIT domain-containing protein [Chryseobacterium]|uniref:VIT domain-containing protein n=1 Tax=Chryseobacterium TaxID=59732 RepID=UPI0019580D76|nr:MULTISPECIES: VIT domain-containing protein [Chryseobacterium]MBM7419935.1 tetratricopeptide (TPR) repeat protein [Chryseobacterium sp. JUb44]MDH6209873.1 Ca-activated chloride channel family protein [Chryseobacterium sp. BIGb0186]WSO08610.1 VIT domain-containing protein [Chryseobacterium scophthalmum]